MGESGNFESSIEILGFGGWGKRCLIWRIIFNDFKDGLGI